MRELKLVAFNKHIPAGQNLIRGLAAISLYLMSDASKEKEVEAMIENHGLPVVHIGDRIVARKSALSRWHGQQIALAAQKRAKRRRRTKRTR